MLCKVLSFHCFTEPRFFGAVKLVLLARPERNILCVSGGHSAFPLRRTKWQPMELKQQTALLPPLTDGDR